MPEPSSESARTDHDRLGSSSGYIGDNQPFRVEMIPTSSLSLTESIRLYSSEERRYLRRIFKRFGIRQPIVANDLNEVIVGQGLFLAAQEIGIAEVPVIRLKALWQARAGIVNLSWAQEIYRQTNCPDYLSGSIRSWLRISMPAPSFMKRSTGAAYTA